mmetsp:Transcript_19819/g.51205  ORF Transcript_19819/g.51205 Transcript_19819/m.51205 type:complete len:268 (-) Transcript_19819:99-902(-)
MCCHLSPRVPPLRTQRCLDVCRQRVVIKVVKVHAERLQTLKHGTTNATSCDRPDVHSLKIVRALHYVRNVPPSAHRVLVSGHKVTHECEDRHHDVLSDRDGVAPGDLTHVYVAVHRRLQVDVVGTNACRDACAQLWCHCHPFGCHVRWEEGLRDHVLGIGKMALKLTTGAVFVRRDDERVALRFEECAQPELAAQAAKQRARREVDPSGTRQSRAVRVCLEGWERVAGVVRREARHRVRVECAQHFGLADHCRRQCRQSAWIECRTQ